jgi:hypothetical protein
MNANTTRLSEIRSTRMSGTAKPGPTPSPFAGEPAPHVHEPSPGAQLSRVLASLYGARAADGRRRRPVRRDPDDVNAPIVFGLIALTQLLFLAVIALTGG